MLEDDALRNMREHLEKAAKDGAELYLGERRVSAGELAWACCVNEEAIYMPDYILGRDGRLAQLRYDRVEQK